MYDYGRDSCKSEESDGEFFITSGDASWDFEALEEVFDLMAFGVKVRIAPTVGGAVGAGRDASEATVLFDEGTDLVGIEALIADKDKGAGQLGEEFLGGGAL